MRSPGLMAALAAAVAAVTLASCGSGNATSPAATGASDDAAGLAFAKCMRAHGLSHFPDPVFRDGRIGQAPGPGGDPNSPAVGHAMRVCGQP